MAPQTFDMPDTIEGEAAPVESLPEANGHVGGGDAWDTDGICISPNVELIEVPFRKTVKSQAKVKVYGDGEGAPWRTGWFWGSLLKKNALDNQGRELSLSRPAFDDRTQAVRAALCEMADAVREFDNRIVDDVLKFRDAEFFVQADQWPDERVQLAHDPETQEAAEDLQSAGIGVDEASAASESPQSGPDAEKEAKLQKRAEAAFRKKFMERASILADAVLERRRAEAVFKTAKAVEKTAGEALETLADRGPERLPLFEAAEKEKESAASGQGDVQSAPTESDTWQSTPLAELELPAHVVDKLTGDGIDTIGRLEARRADIAMKREKWPRGIGKAAIDKIENAVVEWLAAHQPVVDASFEVVDDPPATEVSPAPAAVQSDHGDIGDVVARTKYLVKAGMTGDPANAFYQSGRDAFENGSELSDCPHLPGADQDQWLIGWVVAKNGG